MDTFGNAAQRFVQTLSDYLSSEDDSSVEDIVDTPPTVQQVGNTIPTVEELKRTTESPDTTDDPTSDSDSDADSDSDDDIEEIRRPSRHNRKRVMYDSEDDEGENDNTVPITSTSKDTKDPKAKDPKAKKPPKTSSSTMSMTYIM